MEEYERVYRTWKRRQEKENVELENFIKNIKADRSTRNTKIKVIKEARQYYEYWKIVNEIRELVKDISEKAYPGIPHYLALDHFWHYVKVFWHKETGKVLSQNERADQIPRLFKEYIKWHREEESGDYPIQSFKRSKNIFKRLLSERNIDDLTKQQAKEVFQNLHSSGMPIQRFGADDLFIKENSISKIRKSLKYLVHSKDDIDVKIHKLIKDPDFKLNRLGPSGIQEIIGWTNPIKYPIRNDKADAAVEILGFSLTKA